MVLPSASTGDANKIAERLQDILAQDFYAPEMHQVNLGPLRCSIGIAELSSEHSNPLSLINAADSALYRAKAMGGNNIVLA